jgi:DUF1009 family protein
VLTRRAPSEEEQEDIAYGRALARGIAGFDIGQTVVVAGQACVAVEAMEGTDAAIRRAGELVRGFEGGSEAESASEAEPLLGRALTVVKVAKPKQDLRFDVPVIGVATIAAMREAGATCLSLEAGKTLIFDRAGVLAAADAAGIAIVGSAGMAEE